MGKFLPFRTVSVFLLDQNPAHFEKPLLYCFCCLYSETMVSSYNLLNTWLELFGGPLSQIKGYLYTWQSHMDSFLYWNASRILIFQEISLGRSFFLLYVQRTKYLGNGGCPLKRSVYPIKTYFCFVSICKYYKFIAREQFKQKIHI